MFRLCGSRGRLAGGDIRAGGDASSFPVCRLSVAADLVRRAGSLEQVPSLPAQARRSSLPPGDQPRRPPMDRTAFEAELQREGRQVVTVTMQPNQVNPEHAHDFEARLMVVAGAMTVDYGDRRQTYNEGDTFTMHARPPPRRTGRSRRRHLCCRPPEAETEPPPTARTQKRTRETSDARARPRLAATHARNAAFLGRHARRRTAPAALRRLRQVVFSAAPVLRRPAPRARSACSRPRGKATLWSYVIHHRPVPGFTPPYAIAVVRACRRAAHDDQHRRLPADAGGAAARHAA